MIRCVDWTRFLNTSKSSQIFPEPTNSRRDVDMSAYIFPGMVPNEPLTISRPLNIVPWNNLTNLTYFSIEAARESPRRYVQDLAVGKYRPPDDR